MRLRNLDFMNDPEATDKQEELTAMSISCDAAIIFAERHAELAEKMAGRETDPKRKKGTEKNSGNLPMGSCTCPTYLLGGHTDVLVCPSRHHYRAERMGRHESRTF